MSDILSIGSRFPKLSPLAVRLMLDLYGSEHPLPASPPDELISTAWTGDIPQPSSFDLDQQAVRAFRDASPEARSLILRVATTSAPHPSVETAQEQEAVQIGFILRREDGALHTADSSRRVVALATANPTEVSDALLEGASLTALDPGAHLERVGAPSWAVAWLLAAAEQRSEPIEIALLVARAANVAAFEGDLGLARRLIARGAALGEGDGLLNWTAPARALIQLLHEDDMQASHRTLHATLSKVTDPDIRNQCLTVLALRCMVDPQESGWGEYIETVASEVNEVHPTLNRIAATMSAVNAPDVARISDAQPDRRRSWVEVVESIADVLDAFKTMRLAGHATSEPVGRTSPNALAGLIRTTFFSHVQIQSQFWTAAEETAADALTLARRIESNLLALNAETMLAVVEAFRGERDRAGERVERVLSDPGIRRAHRLRAVTESVIILLEGSRGNYDVALALLLTRRPDHLSLTVGPYGPIEVFDFVDFATKIDMISEAKKRLEESTVLMQTFRSTRADFVLQACEAILDNDYALERMEGLLLEAEGLPFVYEAARLRLVYAERLRRVRRITEARHQLLRVRMDFQNIGAVAWVDRVQRELRTTTREPLDDVVSVLTEQEARVAELAAAGFSNKEIGRRLFLSPRTVAGHLYRLFPKLGVTTRAQLRDALSGAAVEAPEMRSNGSVTPSGQDSRSMSQLASIAPAR